MSRERVPENPHGKNQEHNRRALTGPPGAQNLAE
jgi:hypothetical protein